MGVTFEKTNVKGSFPVFWRGETKVLPGDFKITTELPEGTIVKKGTPVKIDFSKMECKICKAVKVIEGGTTSAPRVEKGSHVKEGDTVGDTQTVSSIDSSNKDYDVLTLSAEESTATAGAILKVGTDEPNGVIERDVTISTNNGFNTASVAYEAVVLRGSAYPVPDAWLVAGMCLNTNHSIKYIYQ